MKNLKIDFDALKNKHRLNLVKGIVIGTIAFNAISLSGCSSANSNEVSVVVNQDETIDYFENVVELDLFGTIYINCDNLPEEIKNGEQEIPQAFYDKLNSFLETAEYEQLIFWHNDADIIDYNKVDFSNIASAKFVSSDIDSEEKVRAIK